MKKEMYTDRNIGRLEQIKKYTIFWDTKTQDYENISSPRFFSKYKKNSNKKLTEFYLVLDKLIIKFKWKNKRQRQKILQISLFSELSFSWG